MPARERSEVSTCSAAAASDDCPAESTMQSGESESVAAKDEDRIPWATRLIFAAPTAGMIPFVIMFSLYGNTSYEAFGAPLPRIALYLALARSLDVVSDPLMSNLTDRAHTRWGRRRPFMFVGAFPYALFLFLLMRPPYGEGVELAQWFGTMYILYFLSNTLVCIPYYALAPELSKNSEERTGLFFVQSVVEGISSLMAMAGPMLGTLTVKGVKWNEWVCKSFQERALHCSEGRSCGEVFSQGTCCAYADNTTLRGILALLQEAPLQLPREERTCRQLLLREDGAAGGLIPFDGAHRGGPLLNLSAAMEAAGNELCNCALTCGQACEVADKRTGFEWVGSIFALWFLVTMIVCVLYIKERSPTRTGQGTSLVPAMLNTMKNGPFRILLPAWACDAYCNAIVQVMVPYFVACVISPSYQEECLDPHAPGYSPWLCVPSNVIAVSGMAVLLAAILGLPIWRLLVWRIGKVRTWWLWSISMATTNLLFVFLDNGLVVNLWIVSALNGLPLGAKFIADSILGDIIDYDEFLTGQRNEATYFMFKGFLPKIVQIPSSAVPIALLGVFGYRPPVAGLEQEQGEGAKWFVKSVVLSAAFMSILSFLLKWRYPLYSEEHLADLRLGIAAHRCDKDYPDPVTKVDYKPSKCPAEVQHVSGALNHFLDGCIKWAFVGDGVKDVHGLEVEELERHICLDVGVQKILWSMKLQVAACIVFMTVSIVSTAWASNLLTHPQLSFLPTFTSVAVGLSLICVIMSVLRLRAAMLLARYAQNEELTASLLALTLLRRDLLSRVGMPGRSPTSSGAVAVQPPTPGAGGVAALP